MNTEKIVSKIAIFNMTAIAKDAKPDAVVLWKAENDKAMALRQTFNDSVLAHMEVEKFGFAKAVKTVALEMGIVKGKDDKDTMKYINKLISEAIADNAGSSEGRAINDARANFAKGMQYAGLQGKRTKHAVWITPKGKDSKAAGEQNISTLVGKLGTAEREVMQLREKLENANAIITSCVVVKKGKDSKAAGEQNISTNANAIITAGVVVKS